MSRPTLAQIEAAEREIAAGLPGGYDGADRVWLRREAFKRLDAIARCSVCEKPLLGEAPDVTGRCTTCSAHNAHAVTCDCGFLYAGERCTCDDCRVCDRPIGNYVPTTIDAKAAPADGLCEQCHTDHVRAARSNRQLEEIAAGEEQRGISWHDWRAS